MLKGTNRFGSLRQFPNLSLVGSKEAAQAFAHKVHHLRADKHKGVCPSPTPLTALSLHPGTLNSGFPHLYRLHLEEKQQWSSGEKKN